MTAIDGIAQVKGGKHFGKFVTAFGIAHVVVNDEAIYGECQAVIGVDWSVVVHGIFLWYINSALIRY